MFGVNGELELITHSKYMYVTASLEPLSFECGTETTVEVLPRLNKIKFDSGVLDELLFVDMPQEYRLPSGIMLLECSKAIQESVYEKLRVIREGRLRIVFGLDMKVSISTR